MSYLDEIDDPRPPNSGTLRLPGDPRILIAAIVSGLRRSRTSPSGRAPRRRGCVNFPSCSRTASRQGDLPADPARARSNSSKACSGARSVAWSVRSATMQAYGGTIAIDGVTVRGSGTGGRARSTWSAPCHRAGTGARPGEVAAKSNEITAIPGAAGGARSRGCWSR